MGMRGGKWTLVFVSSGAKHEIFYGFAGVFAFVEDLLHLLGDGHFNIVLACEAEGGAGGEDAFSDFAAERGENFRQLASLAERVADCPIAAQ